MSENRAPWYRVVVQVGSAHIDCTLSGEDELQLAEAMAKTGRPFQVWCQRADASVEMLSVVPGQGVRYQSRVARPIPVDARGQPVRVDAQGRPEVAIAGTVAPTDSRYGDIVMPAVLRPVPYVCSGADGIVVQALSELRAEVERLRREVGELRQERSRDESPQP